MAKKEKDARELGLAIFIFLLVVVSITFISIGISKGIDYLNKEDKYYDEFGEDDWCVKKCSQNNLEKVNYVSVDPLNLYCVCEDRNTGEGYLFNVFRQ